MIDKNYGLHDDQFTLDFVPEATKVWTSSPEESNCKICYMVFENESFLLQWLLRINRYEVMK